ncbi:MAG: putative ABC transporter permease, partial [Lachnospiraceae bacterium]|nr:putative ABC transporter permease [Lachnospiraceae bacterium]
MYIYSVQEWLLFFYIYCFLGWCFESTYVSLRKGHWVNRGFMRAPFLPLYGSGAILMLIVGQLFRDNVFLTYLVGLFAATLLEFFTGLGMEWFYKIKYWDYSNQRCNFMGHICLTSSIAWGF